MKILQINTVYKTGSTGRITHNLNGLIVKKGWKSFIGFGRGNWNDENIVKIGSKLDMYIHGIGTRIFDKHGLFSKQATEQFIKKIDKLDIDIFHLHNIHGYYLHYPTLFSYLKDKKVIWTLHDCWAFTGHCSHYDFIKCDKWKKECFQCPQKLRYPSSLVFDNSQENFLLKKEYFTSLENLTIVTPSNWLKNEVKQSFLNKYQIEVIYNGIDINIFKPIKTNFREKYNLENKFLILGVANVWDERKGLEYFIKLAQKISIDEHIILIGLNSKQIKKLPKNILGCLNTDSLKELAEIYSTVNIFVNLTLEEVLGLTNIEALACKTPVITFNSGGSPEVIDEETGAVIEKGNIEYLYQTIKQFKQKNDSFTKDQCRNRVINYFNKDDRFNEYIKLYQKVYK